MKSSFKLNIIIKINFHPYPFSVEQFQSKFNLNKMRC